MKVVVHNRKHDKVDCSTGLENRIGFWATVTEVNSMENNVRVISDSKMEYIGIPVVSLDEWVCKGEEYVTGSRNLPPVGARVFVLVPAGTISSAFVLCSGYTRGDGATHALWGTDSDAEEKSRIRERVSQGGWNKQENYDTGKYTVMSKDGNLSLSIDLENQMATVSVWNSIIEVNGNDEKITLSAWDTAIEINADGVKLAPKKLEITSSGDITLDAGQNNFTIKAARFAVNPGAAGASLEVM